MNYKASSIDIMAAVHASLEFPVEIKSAVESPAGTWTLTVCDIYHAQIGFDITIDSSIYTITDFSFENSTITVIGSAPITATEFELYHPYFFHGTLSATNVEIAQELDASKKTPMVWMREFPMKDKFTTKIEDPIERTMTDTSLFFLSQCDPEKWQTGESYEKVIMPMRRLQENFLAKMEEMLSVFNLEEWNYDVTNYAKLSVYASGKSDKKAFFVDKLAGCEMPLSGLKVLKSGVCKIEC